MEPVVEKLLQGIPFAGMGTTLERNGLIGVVRNLIKANKYTVEYILNYCESVGYQRKMAEEVFEELTGLSPKLIINNNEYYNAPIYVPACTIAWGLAKSKKETAFYVVPGSYGYSVMEKNETDAPVEVTQTATIPEAIDELKKVAKNIQTLDKIITSKLLETEDVQSSANDIDQTAKPYFSDPIRELKKNFKNKVIDINTFEREARKLVAEQKISVKDGEHLMDWEQDLLDNSENPEEYNKVLQKDEEWNQLQGTETEGDFEDAYHQLFNMLEELDILSQFAADTGHNEKEAYIELAKDIGQEFGVDYKSLLSEMELRNPEVVKKIEELSLKSNEKEIKTWINSSKKVKSWTSDEEDEYLNSDEYLDSYEYLYSQLVNGNITEYKNGVKKLFQEGPSKVMEYMDWLEEHNINPKEALKVMKNASLKKVESNFTLEQEEKFKHLWELNEQGNISEYETELKNMEGSDIVKFINWMGFYGKDASSKKATNIPTGNVPTEKITLADGRTFTVRYNPKEKGITTIFNEDGKEIGVDAATRLQLLRKLFHKGEPTIVESKKKNAGYSNNPNYVGDWFGEGQIDFSKIINPEDDGKVYMLKIWCGSGYILDVYLVKANDMGEAIDKVFHWSYENEGHNDIIFDYDYVYNYALKCFKETPDMFGKKQEWEDFLAEFEQEEYVGNEDYTLFARSENFFVDEVPEKYLQKATLDKRLSSKKVTAETYKDIGWTIEKNNDGYIVRNENGYIMHTPFKTEEEAEKYINEPVKSNNKKIDNYYPIFDGRKKASKKVTAENMTLDDIEEDKTEVEEQMEKINDTPAKELMEDTTPLDYFDKETQDDKVDTINDVVSKCITEFSDKFKEFTKYDVSILSYKTKILAPYTPNQEEMVEDKELNADALLQVILTVNNKADESTTKKLLAVFSITDGKMQWNGTVRDEDDNVVAFNEQGLDSIFNENEEEVEETDIKEVI